MRLERLVTRRRRWVDGAVTLVDFLGGGGGGGKRRRRVFQLLGGRIFGAGFLGRRRAAGLTHCDAEVA